MARRRTLADVSSLICGGKIYLAAEPLNAGGYTRSGRYFGAGEKLWSFANDNSSGYVRAPSKAEAKAKLERKCPRGGLAGASRRRKRRK